MRKKNNEKSSLSLMVRKTNLNRIGLDVKKYTVFEEIESVNIFNNTKSGYVNGKLSPNSMDINIRIDVGFYSRYQLFLVKNLTSLINSNLKHKFIKFILPQEYISSNIHKFKARNQIDFQNKLNLKVVRCFLMITKLLFFHESVNKHFRKICSTLRNIFKKRFLMDKVSISNPKTFRYIGLKKKNILFQFRPDLLFNSN